MTAIKWDETGSRLYETGVKNGVLYPLADDGTYGSKTAGTGVAWNGLSGVTESPSGADEQAIYADDIKYLSLRSVEEFGCTIEAYTYPDEFAECDGSALLDSALPGVTIGQQPRKTFGLCYRTTLGNDTEKENHGYKLHLVYGCTASPSSKDYKTINDSPEAITMSWEVKTVPVEVEGHKPTATIVIDSTKVGATKMAKLEAALYGDAAGQPYLPLPAEVITILKAA